MAAGGHSFRSVARSSNQRMTHSSVSSLKFNMLARGLTAAAAGERRGPGEFDVIVKAASQLSGKALGGTEKIDGRLFEGNAPD